MNNHAIWIFVVGALSLAACKKQDNAAGSADKASAGSAAAPADKRSEGSAAAPAPAPASADQPSAGSAATPVAASATGASAGCVGGAYKDPHGVYCVKVPEGFKPPASTRKADAKSIDQFETDDGFNFTISYWRAELGGGKLEDMKAQFSADNGLKKLATEELPGSGLYVKRHNDAQKEDSMESVIQAGGKVIICEVVYPADKPIKPDDACRTLRGQ